MIMGDCPWKQVFKTHVRNIVATDDIPGLAFGVAKDGEIIESGGVGFRNLAEEIPTTPDTVYGIGSVTKSFTALAVMQLHDRGQLNVEDPVNKWLPEFNLPGEADTSGITLHHLLNHTSGIPPLRTVFNSMARSMKDDPSVEQFRDGIADLKPIDTQEELMELIAELDFEPFGPPGEFFSYSNDGYALLGAVIERAADQSYSSYLEQNIFEPLGMNHTTLNTDKLDEFGEVTELYSPKDENGKRLVYHSPGWWEFPATEAAGQMMSTVNDLLTYLEVYRCLGEVDGERIASEESVRQMMYPHASGPYPPNNHYGYGLSIQTDYHGVTLVGHGGGIKGVAADILLAVEDDITAVALSNLAGGSSSSVTRGAVNVLKHLPPDAPGYEHPDYDGSPEEKQKFVGSYRSDEGASIDISLADDQLFVRMGDKTYMARLIAEDVIAFTPSANEMTIKALSDEKGDTWAVFTGSRIIQKVDQLAKEDSTENEKEE